MMLFRAVKQTDAARLAELRRPGAAPEVQRALSAAAISVITLVEQEVVF